MAMLACATVVKPPARPADPTLVFLIDQGRTSSLALPTPDGGMMRYVYGNWEWYALMHTGVWSGLKALLWPSQAALGRERYPGPNTAENAERQFGEWSQAVYPIAVSGARARALAARLDERFNKNIATLHVNAEYHLDFVKDPAPYHLLHDSNDEIAAWLEWMGCQVSGPAIYAKWRVEPAEAGRR